MTIVIIKGMKGSKGILNMNWTFWNIFPLCDQIVSEATLFEIIFDSVEHGRAIVVYTFIAGCKIYCWTYNNCKESFESTENCNSSHHHSPRQISIKKYPTWRRYREDFVGWQGPNLATVADSPCSTHHQGPWGAGQNYWSYLIFNICN